MEQNQGEVCQYNHEILVIIIYKFPTHIAAITKLANPIKVKLKMMLYNYVTNGTHNYKEGIYVEYTSNNYRLPVHFNHRIMDL